MATEVSENTNVKTPLAFMAEGIRWHYIRGVLGHVNKINEHG